MKLKEEISHEEPLVDKNEQMHDDPYARPRCQYFWYCLFADFPNWNLFSLCSFKIFDFKI